MSTLFVEFFCRSFFRLTNLIFQALAKHPVLAIYQDPILAAGKIVGKKQAQKAFLGPFWKILGSVSQKWISQKSTKGEPLGR